MARILVTGGSGFIGAGIIVKPVRTCWVYGPFVDGTEAVRKGALDITRARTELGYEPRYPIKNGLAAYIEATRAGRG